MKIQAEKTTVGAANLEEFWRQEAMQLVKNPGVAGEELGVPGNEETQRQWVRLLLQQRARDVTQVALDVS